MNWLQPPPPRHLGPWNFPCPEGRQGATHGAYFRAFGVCWAEEDSEDTRGGIGSRGPRVFYVFIRDHHIRPCRIHISHQKSPISLSTSCRTNRKHSPNAVSSQSHGFRAPENTFSVGCTSTVLLKSKRGKRLFLTLPTRLDATPVC